MQQDPKMKLCYDGADATVGARAERLGGPRRRAPSPLHDSLRSASQNQHQSISDSR